MFFYTLSFSLAIQFLKKMKNFPNFIGVEKIASITVKSFVVPFTCTRLPDSWKIMFSPFFKHDLCPLKYWYAICYLKPLGPNTFVNLEYSFGKVAQILYISQTCKSVISYRGIHNIFNFFNLQSKKKSPKTKQNIIE